MAGSTPNKEDCPWSQREAEAPELSTKGNCASNCLRWSSLYHETNPTPWPITRRYHKRWLHIWNVCAIGPLFERIWQTDYHKIIQDLISDSSPDCHINIQYRVSHAWLGFEFSVTSIMTKATWGGTDLLHLITLRYSQSLREGGAGTQASTWRQDLKQRGVVHWLALLGLLRLLSYTTQTSSPEVTPSTMGWVLPSQSLNNKMSPQTCYRPI